MRLGIFGGTFDPVHLGHLLLAECMREACALDEVWLMPTAANPHKPQGPVASDQQRVEMLQLAVADNRPLVVCTLEIDRGGTSYTIDTLTAIVAERPEAELFLLMGADSLADLPNWREPERICQLALPLVAARPGAAPVEFDRLASLVSAERLAEIRAAQFESPVIDISSTDIRDRVAALRSIRYRTPRAVEEYIRAEGLYQT